MLQAKLQFIEAARKMTRIAAFREAQVYGRIQQRDTIAARMFQKHWMAYVARRKGGIVRFDYAKFKEKLLFLEGCRKMTRIASFRESLIYNRIAMAKMIAALMFQKAWKAHRVRVRENIIPLRRFLFRDSRRMAPSRENSRLSDVSA